MITEKYRYPGKVKARYVRKDLNGRYSWCETSADKPQYDLAQGTCDGEDLPDDVRQKADAYGFRGYFYACEWPLQKA